MKIFLLGLASFACLLAGCTTDESKTQTQTPAFGAPVSTIPWDKPEQWEQGGQLGGAVPGLAR
jgi:hypothetical protein